MDGLTKFLVDSILKEEEGVTALFGGGFKPPTKGHLEVVLKGIKENPEINNVIIYVGSGVRNNISQEEAIKIWEMYQKLIPVPSQIVGVGSPFNAYKQYLTDHPDQTTYVLIGGRVGNEDDDKDIAERSKFIGKYNGIPKVVSTPDAGISGTAARAAAKISKEKFLKFIPDELEDNEKDLIYSFIQSVVNELEDKEIKYWATQADIFSILKKFPNKYKELAQKLKGERLDALNYFWNTYFKDGESLLESVDFKALEKVLDDMFEDLDIDINFTKHFKERVIERGLTEEDIIELMEKIHDQYGDEVADLYRDENRVFTHLKRLVDIAAVNVGYGDDYLKDLVLKTAYKRNSPDEPEFRTNSSSPKLAVNENASYSKEIDIREKINQLTHHMIDKGMNIEPLPSLEFVDGDTENARDFFGKTAYYEPDTQTIVLYTEGRHPKDIVRSYAHEMIHHIQNLEGRLGNITTTNTQEDDHLNDLEAEANLKGTMTFRNWTDSLNEVGDASQKPYNWVRKISKDDDIIEGVDYRFTTDLDTSYVAFFQMVDDASYEFGFNIPGGNQAQVSNKGELFRVMATMVAIMKDFMDLMGNDWSEISFSGSKDPSRFDDNRRDKLYMAYIKKHLPSTVNVGTDDDDMTVLSNTLAEGFNKKLGKDPFGLNQFARELMTEGAYDALTTKLTRATIQKWVEDSKKKPMPKKSFVDIDIDEFDGKGREIEFNYVGIVEFDKKIDGYEVDGTSNSGEDKGKMPFVATMFRINPKILPQAWSKISADVSDVIRHEIEHLTQAGDNVRGQVYDEKGNLIDKGKYMDDDIMIRDMINKLKVLPKSDYYKLEKEVDAMLQGLYLKAKKTRKPFADVINNYLDMAPGIDTKEEKEVILNLWRSRRKALSLPVFENKEQVMDYKIFLDMDGVLVDFDKQFEELTGMPPREFESKYDSDKFWEAIDGAGVGFWRGMKWMPGGEALYNRASQFDHVLLSSPSRSEVSKIGKRLWRRDKTPDTKLILARSYNKKNYAAPNHILIDDRADNIQQWRDAGGIGILYKSAEQVNAELDKLGL